MFNNTYYNQEMIYKKFLYYQDKNIGYFDDIINIKSISIID